MVDSKIYEDIAKRTNGDIYIGVVGPVRTGKSTFIRKFMEMLVLPNIEEGAAKDRIVDELPQSGDGKIIMTTQPKFVPNQSAKVLLNNVETNVRLIDCVGYPYEGVNGFIEDGKERKIITPWSEEEMVFSKAAKVGTDKVMADHSTIGIVITHDGSIENIKRGLFVDAEEQIINEMKQLEKPFVIIVNTVDKNNKKSIVLKEELEEKYNMPVLLENIEKIEKESLEKILYEVLKEFPMQYVDVDIPRYLQALTKDNDIIKHIIQEFYQKIKDIHKMSEIEKIQSMFENDEYIDRIDIKEINYDIGRLLISLIPKNKLFYDVIPSQSGQIIEDEFRLVSYIKDLSKANKEYEKIKNALLDADEYGYGVMIPKEEDMEYDDPEIVKKGNKNIVKMKAGACSYHILKIDVETQVSPFIGANIKNEEMVENWLESFEEDYEKLWDSNMFGKTLKTLAKEGIENKLMSLSDDVKGKMKKTICKIVNDGKGGVICLLL